jgi:hypothetical protein
MTKGENKIKQRLENAWKKRLGRYVKARGLYAKAEGLYAKANGLWAQVILETKGNIKMEWKNWTEKGYECHLETGEIFRP